MVLLLPSVDTLQQCACARADGEKKADGSMPTKKRGSCQNVKQFDAYMRIVHFYSGMREYVFYGAYL
jgi:hypothetical protein